MLRRMLVATLLGALLVVAAPTAAFADRDDRGDRGDRHRSEHRFRDHDDGDGRFFGDFRRHRSFIFIERPYYSPCGWGHGRFGGYGYRHCGYGYPGYASRYPVSYGRCGLEFYGHYRYPRACGYGAGPWY
jgi:hypothetical protein